MRSTSSRWMMMALLAPTVAAQMDFNAGEFVKGLPGMIKSNLRTFRTGTSTMYKNWGAARQIQQAALKGGTELSYSDLVLIRRTGEDTNKFLMSGFIWMAAPELFPAMLYFNPRSIPSTFESEAGRAKRYDSMARKRTRAALDLLSTLE